MNFARAAAVSALIACSLADATAQEPSVPTLQPRLRFQTTAGDFVLELDAARAPITVLNFIDYAEAGFYDGTLIHRVVPGQTLHGGRFTEQMEPRLEGLKPPIHNEWSAELKNTRGTIAMSRGRAPNSATSEFFINIADNPRYDRLRGEAAYCVFGRVVEGLGTLDSIARTRLVVHPKYPSVRPSTPEVAVVIRSVQLVGVFAREAAEAKRQAFFEERERVLREAIAAAEAEKQRLIDERRAEIDLDVEKIVRKVEKKKRTETIRTDSGLYYIVVREGSGPSPRPGDSVVVHYRGELASGDVFDDSYERGAPATFEINTLIQGWQEGLQLMKPGAKTILIVPSYLGYGAQDNGEIPPDSTLIFELELIDVIPADAADDPR